MAEHDRLTLAPVFVENLNAIFRFDGIDMDDSLAVVVRGRRCPCHRQAGAPKLIG
jgi:hypothetical protein